ncbi:MAG: 5'-3' exonuclease [Actinomycetota bacterium]|nr:5'-3' exonuclease [Actinomycetota bacterium]
MGNVHNSRPPSIRLLLDAPSLVYRAFFALPATVTDPQGRPVNAVRGFLDMTARLATDRPAGEIVTVFDADWRPKFRVDAYPGYKAQRPDDPQELPPQFDVIAEVLDAAGVKRVEAPGLEADDAIATLVAQLDDGERASVVTGDRDLLALVKDPQVDLLFPVKGLSDPTRFDESAVEAKYGIRPALYPAFATLRGDSSDGLPGVAGIGPVRAAKLLNEWGSIDGILEHLEALPPKQAGAFDEARDYLEAMKTVVSLVTDAKLEATPGGAPDEHRIRSLAEQHGLGSSSARFLRALKAGS